MAARGCNGGTDGIVRGDHVSNADNQESWAILADLKIMDQSSCWPIVQQTRETDGSSTHDEFNIDDGP